MRKVEEKMIAAVKRGKGFCGGNTAVTWNDSGRAFYVSLHGNTIARGELDAVGNPVLTAVNLCGWNTVTTRSRLNAFGLGIYTKRFVPYIGATEVPESGWTEVHRR